MKAPTISLQALAPPQYLQKKLENCTKKSSVPQGRYFFAGFINCTEYSIRTVNTILTFFRHSLRYIILKKCPHLC
ncbi:MAG: hypothetical protein D3920_04395 [Candidatus Electrothrix sp. AW2]|nr:hypothetical protein [Candidatus Electrothrix gigas]